MSKLLLLGAILLLGPTGTAQAHVGVAGTALLRAVRPTYHRVWVFSTLNCVLTAFPSGGAAGAPIVAITACVTVPPHFVVTRVPPLL
jgi:hypothetical protein